MAKSLTQTAPVLLLCAADILLACHLLRFVQAKSKSFWVDGKHGSVMGPFLNCRGFFFFCNSFVPTEVFSSSPICPVAELTAGVSHSNESVDESRELSLLCWELLLVCCWPSLPAAHSAKRELLSQAAGHSQYLSDPQLFRLPRPLQSLSPETPAVLAGQSAHVYVWDRLGPEALPF